MEPEQQSTKDSICILKEDTLLIFLDISVENMAGQHIENMQKYPNIYCLNQVFFVTCQYTALRGNMSGRIQQIH